jgi:hypothetical protein
MQGPPSNLTPSADDTKPPENNNTPTINILTRVFFIEFLLLGVQITNCKFPLCFSITHNPLALMGISEYGTDFSRIGNLEEGRSALLLIRALSGKNSRLTEVPFWDCPEGIFHFIGRQPYRGLFLILRLDFLLPD